MNSEAEFSTKAERDRYLVKKAREGDQQAFAELLSSYRDSLFFMMKKMVNNVDDAEDLTIESFGKAFNLLESYTGKFAFSTWLFKIATNHCIDFIRKQKKLTLLSIDEGSDDDILPSQYILSENPDPEEKMIWQQKGELLNDFIHRLHPDYQEIIKLKYFQGFSYIEIAEELGIPLGTVKARLYRSKELLLSTLKDKDL
ncbi:MAG: sigma-70 family RNA polymerase sigma factor [Bacteroidota bacterium]